MAFLHTLSSRAVPYFNPTCPQGGKWYACDSTTRSKFIGCCTADPCDKGCPDGNLETVSFNGSTHGTYPDASCPYNNFWTCNGTTPPFWGCCRSNPCATKIGCPSTDLVAAFMARPEQFAAYATGTIDSSPSATGSPKPTSTPEGSSSHTGTIAGAVIGAFIVVVLIIAVLIFVLRRRRQAAGDEAKPIGVEQAPMDFPPSSDHKHNYVPSPGLDAPPMYSSPNPNAYSYRSVSQTPQELPDEIARSPTTGMRGRFSELPADGETELTELESPQPSPKPPQGGFSKSGLGVGLGVR